MTFFRLHTHPSHLVKPATVVIQSFEFLCDPPLPSSRPPARNSRHRPHGLYLPTVDHTTSSPCLPGRRRPDAPSPSRRSTLPPPLRPWPLLARPPLRPGHRPRRPGRRSASPAAAPSAPPPLSRYPLLHRTAINAPHLDLRTRGRIWPPHASSSM